MNAPTFTKTGNKSTTPAKLDKDIFEMKVEDQSVLNQAYVAYLANGRENLAVTKTRGLVRGGGRKPWRQKGTGRARFGSTRNPIWRGGGITFGPTGQENYSHKLSPATKRLAIKQALSLAKDIVIVIETFECKDGKVKPTVNLLNKTGATGNVLLVVDEKNELVERATRNIPNVLAVQANYLNVYDVVNADKIVISKKALELIGQRLKGAK